MRRSRCSLLVATATLALVATACASDPAPDPYQGAAGDAGVADASLDQDATPSDVGVLPDTSHNDGAAVDSGQDSPPCDAGPAPAFLSCGSGKTLYQGQCLLPYQPTLNVSDTIVAPGASVAVAWNGGAYANTCSVSPWPSAPAGTGAATIDTDTAFSMTCINGSGDYLSPQPVIPVHVETNPALQPFLQAINALGVARYAAWSKSFGIWEVEYDGTGAPTDNVPMAFAWDNPIDDDGLGVYAAGRGFRFDTPSVGFLTVDRHADPADWGKGSVISRRDEFLDSSYGLTLEFRAAIFPDSGIYDGVDHDAFRVHYQMENGVVLGLFLSPTAIKAGGYVLPTASVAFDTTAFNTYRIVQDPGSSHFSVYVNDVTTPILEGDGTDQYPVSSVVDHEHPTIIIGGEGVYRAHFTLDYVRYRRGAYPPGSSIPPPLTRSPSPLPPPLPACTSVEFHPGFDGTLLPNDPGSVVEGYQSAPPSGWKLLPGGIVELNELPPSGNVQTAYVSAIPNVQGKGDITIEARIRVMPDSQPRGFSIVLSDDMGTVTLFLSPDRAELALGIKNVGLRDIGIQAAPMVTTDQFHLYRLVRPANQLYAHLYIDDDPVPRIVDQHGDASMRLGLLPSPTTAYLEFGHMFNPESAPGVPLLGHVQIDFIRWSPTAYGPSAIP
ncbi:MAG: hypothetical protein HY898_07750 [Deltaproteobacteria bacterium]|nr:hypothetical protein [Deltaproteobacteria bacterium]